MLIWQSRLFWLGSGLAVGRQQPPGPGQRVLLGLELQGEDGDVVFVRGEADAALEGGQTAQPGDLLDIKVLEGKANGIPLLGDVLDPQGGGVGPEQSHGDQAGAGLRTGR